MTDQDPGKRRGWGVVAGLAAAALGASAAVYAATRDAPVKRGDRAAIEAVVHDYILEHPEIIPQAVDVLRQRETAAAISLSRKQIETPFDGAWAGDPRGDVVVTEFFDYACGFCKAALPDVERLIAEDKHVKVVFRELPILSDASDKAARVSLAAAKQGRFLPFHHAMYQSGALDDAKIAGVSQSVGLAAPRAAEDLKGADIAAEIDTNLALARALKMTGTPTFIVGDRLLNGAVGYDALKAAVAEARSKRG